MANEQFPVEICFDTPAGRLCLPISSTGPTVPPIPQPQVGTLQLGDRLTISACAQDLHRLLDFEAILVETVQAPDDNPVVSRDQLVRVLRREADHVLGNAEAAILRAGPYLTRFSKEISSRINRSCQNECLPKKLRDILAHWQRQHPDLAATIGALPAEAGKSLVRYRAMVDQTLDDFSAGKPPTIELSCEGSTAGCAIMGFLVGAAAATGNIPAAAVGVAGIGWCCG